jgi:hypothetical protein
MVKGDGAKTRSVIEDKRIVGTFRLDAGGRHGKRFAISKGGKFRFPKGPLPGLCSDRGQRLEQRRDHRPLPGLGRVGGQNVSACGRIGA